MNVGGTGAVAPAVLETLEFPAALALVAAHAAGPLGAARVRERRPDTDAPRIRAALAQVAELTAFLLTDDALHVEPVPDITAALDLLAVPGSALEGSQFARLTEVLAAARVTGADLKRLATALPRTAGILAPLPPKELEPRLKASVDPEGTVLDGASRDLARARKAVLETRARLVARLDGMLGKLDPTDRAPDAAVTIRNGRYVIPVRSLSRGKVGGIVHDESATRATVFLEPPEVIELGNELRAKEAEAQREVLRVLRELTDLLRPHRDAIAGAWEMCIAFDDLSARAHYAVQVNGHAPTIGEGPLAIRDGRHPLLLEGHGVVVPFDVALAPDEFTLLVSGPNTGGKTVLIKAVGLLCLLAQSGIIPPIGPQSSLPLCTGVFADIGDRQSIAASLSTFSAHVRILREILEGAGPGALVLLDEIGSGTDPAEGGALASAVLRTLTRRRAITMATTHLGALKQLAADTVGIVNASLQFDAETLTPTYRLLKGVPGRSYGLAIARRLGVPEAVLAEAERAVPDAERTLDALLAEVENRSRELETREREVAERTEAVRIDGESLAARAGLAAEREAAVRERERSLDAAAREQARAYLLEARKRVEEALGRARAAVDEETAKAARRLVEEAIAETKTDGTTARRHDGTRVKVGDRVRTGTSTIGTVVELRDDGQVVLQIGNVRLVVDAGAVTVAGSGEGPGTAAEGGVPAGRSGAPDTTATATSEISLRGLRYDEAEIQLERAIDEAIAADLPYLRVIHGKGTGALRELVQTTCERDRRVKKFGFAPSNQGGAGVTVIEFRA